MDKMAWRSLRGLSRVALARKVDLQVTGLENIPDQGPVIVAARHYHHLYDGCALLATIPRQAHVVAGLDWMQPGLGAALMKRACGAAAWPVVYRKAPGQPDIANRFPALRQAFVEMMAILEAGRVLLIFPEGYPVVDPHASVRQDDGILPFQPGFAHIARAAARNGLRVPIVPAGFAYEQRSRWKVDLAFGAPVIGDDAAPTDRIVLDVERAVRRLSALD